MDALPPLDCLKDSPRFGLHRVAVLGRADAQPLLDDWIEVADGNAAHRYGFIYYTVSHDFNAINDSMPAPLLAMGGCSEAVT